MPKEIPYGDILIEIEKGLWEHDCRVDDGIADGSIPPMSYERILNYPVPIA